MAVTGMLSVSAATETDYTGITALSATGKSKNAHYFSGDTSFAVENGRKYNFEIKTAAATDLTVVFAQGATEASTSYSLTSKWTSDTLSTTSTDWESFQIQIPSDDSSID